MAAFQIQKLVSIIFIILLLIPTVSFIQDNNNYLPIVSGNTESFTDVSNGARAVNWQLVEQIENTVVVPEGSDYFIQLDTQAGVLREKLAPAPEAGLNGRAQKALEKVPTWLHEPLALKLRETASSSIGSILGTASPAFVDIDNDNDLDLIMGEGFGPLSMFENKGNQYEAIFVENNYTFEHVNNEIGQVVTGIQNTVPTAADIDGDFDTDVLVGTDDGRVILLENHGMPGSPQFINVTFIDGMQVSSNAAPHLVDFDGDADFDVVVGDGSGRLHLYTNIGTPGGPQWVRDLSNPFSEIQAAGDAAPFLHDLDNDGDLDITIGDSSNLISYYRCITSGVTSSYVLDETKYLGLPVGESNHPALVDIDSDSIPELFSGSMIDAGSALIYYFENYGNIFDPQWSIWSSYQAIPGINYYPPVEFLQFLDFTYTDKFSDVIQKAYDSDPRWVDETAFGIAATPAGLLRMMGVEVQLFYDNAKYIYEIAPHLAYADIKEHNAQTDDHYSTVEYRTLVDGKVVTREYPKDIYYWYIVHPKITEEFPGYVDPENGQFVSPTAGGRFWREYLFFHNDQSYPSDTSGSPSDGIDDYPTTIGPPLLKDLLSGVSYLWNDTKFLAPGGRDQMYGSNAVIRVSNWVGKTLILNQQEVSDDERPTQPVRIAHHHNGNCGELQDLTTAASRTVLIPAAGVNLVAEDHVWIEFYENGWKQWDNHWSDAGSYINRYDLYWYGWNGRGGSGIWHHRGDDNTIDVTQKYIPPSAQSKVLINVQDRRGQPVDGARVLVGSHWMAEGNIDQMDVTFPFPGIWNYTDVNGESEFHLAKQNFTIKIISKLGNAVQEKTYIGSGETYYFNFTLEGLVPGTVLNTRPMSYPSPPDPEFKVEMEFTVRDGIQEPPNPESGFYHPEVQERSNKLNFFITDESGFNNYQQGLEFEVTNIQPGISVYTTPELFYVSGFGWYFVLSNHDVVETAKTVDVKLKLYKPLVDVPFVSINSPVNNSVVFVGDRVLIEGSVQDEDGINGIALKIEDLLTDKIVVDAKLDHNNDNNWSYDWDTQKVGEGVYRIEVTATDTKKFSNTASILLSLILAGAPEVVILNPLPNAKFDVGDTIEVNGTVTDNGYLTAITVSFDGGSALDITNSYDEGFYKYLWDTKRQDPGFIEIAVTAEDDDGNTASTGRIIELIQPPPPPDVTPPELSILTPEYGSQYTQGTNVLVQGYAYDENEIVNLYLTFGDKEAIGKPTMTDETGWSYVWDTTSEPSGEMMLAVHAEDAAGNHGTFEVLVTILEPLPPQDNDPPVVVIISPGENEDISAGTQVVISGTVIDNRGVVKIELSIDRGDSWIDLTSSITDTSWFYSMSTTTPQLWPDLYTLTVRANDEAGNEGEAEISVSIVDNSAPELEIVTPADNAKFGSGETIGIAGFASDNFQVDRLQVRYNDERRWKDVSTRYEENTGSWSIDVEASDLDIGENTIWFKVTDIYGNEKEDDLRVIIGSAPVEKDEGNVLENTLEFLFLDLLGLMLCGIFIVIFAIVIFAATRNKRRTV